jgi:hypothetical protein
MSYCVRHWNVFGIRYQLVTGYEQWTGEHAATIHQDLHPEGLKRKPRRTLYLDGRFLDMSDAGTCIVYINVMDVSFRPKRAQGNIPGRKVCASVSGMYVIQGHTHALILFAKNTPVSVPCFLTRTRYRTPIVTTYSVLLKISTVSRLLKGMHKLTHWGRSPGYNSNLHSNFFYLQVYWTSVNVIYTIRVLY